MRWRMRWRPSQDLVTLGFGDDAIDHIEIGCGCAREHAILRRLARLKVEAQEIAVRTRRAASLGADPIDEIPMMGPMTFDAHKLEAVLMEITEVRGLGRGGGGSLLGASAGVAESDGERPEVSPAFSLRLTGPVSAFPWAVWAGARGARGAAAHLARVDGPGVHRLHARAHPQRLHPPLLTRCSQRGRRRRV